MRDTPTLVTHDGGDCHHLDLCHLDKDGDDDCDADVATCALVLLCFLACIVSHTMEVIALLPFSMCCNHDQWETSIFCLDHLTNQRQAMFGHSVPIFQEL